MSPNISKDHQPAGSAARPKDTLDREPNRPGDAGDPASKEAQSEENARRTGSNQDSATARLDDDAETPE